MNTYPILSRKPSHTFADEPSNKAVIIGSTASGYPVLNKQFTFDPRTFTFDLHSVLDADKITVMAFYEANKEIPFYWLNVQDSVTYEVAFVERPGCKMDGRIDLWRIKHILRQTSSDTT